MSDTLTTLSRWHDYYAIVGSAGAALIGVQFVVITLVAYLRRATFADTVRAFATPTVAHFTAALVVAAIMSAPWPSLPSVSVALAACGAGGLVYGALVIYRARRQRGYQPVWQDWLWYAILPCAVYATLGATAVLLPAATDAALFAIAASALALLLIGIHNAWDSVTHIVVGSSTADGMESRDREKNRNGN